MLVTAVVARRNSTTLDPVRLYALLNPRRRTSVDWYPSRARKRDPTTMSA